MASDFTSTVLLLARIRQGDLSAREILLGRYIPILRGWARGKLPAYARDLNQTEDLVQETIQATLPNLEKFEIRREGAFLAYLRTILQNLITDLIRQARRRPVREVLDPEIADRRRSIVEEAIGRESLERYERALAELSEEQREALILRLEFDYSYPQIAEAMGKPSANAARMVVSRALVRLVKGMNEFRP